MGAFGTKDGIAMPVSPIKPVRNEEGRHHAQCLHAIELILANRLGMDHNGTTVRQTMLSRCLINHIQELIARTATVAMGQHLPATREQAINQCVDNIVFEQRILDIVFRAG